MPFGALAGPLIGAGIGALGSLFGGGEEQRTSVDPQTAAFLARMRQQAGAGADAVLGQPGSFFTGPLQQTPGQLAQAFFNPFQQQVIGGIQGQFDHLRGLASRDARQRATQAGAFGGSRAAVLEGSRLGALDRAQAQLVGNFLNRGFQNALSQGVKFGFQKNALRQQQLMEPLFRQQQALALLRGGLGPTGQIVSQSGPGLAQGIIGGGLTGFGIQQELQEGQGG